MQEAELLEALRPLGFVSFDPGARSVQDQNDIFAAADVVVAPHGAGLTNLNVSPEGVRVLELFSPRYLNPAFWGIAANVADSQYRYLVAEPAEPDRPASKMLGVQDDIDIPAERVVAAVENSSPSDLSVEDVNVSIAQRVSSSRCSVYHLTYAAGRLHLRDEAGLVLLR